MQFFANPEVLVALDEKRAKKLFFILGFWPFWGLPKSIGLIFDWIWSNLIRFDEKSGAIMSGYKNH